MYHRTSQDSAFHVYTDVIYAGDGTGLNLFAACDGFGLFRYISGPMSGRNNDLNVLYGSDMDHNPNTYFTTSDLMLVDGGYARSTMMSEH